MLAQPLGVSRASACQRQGPGSPCAAVPHRRAPQPHRASSVRCHLLARALTVRRRVLNLGVHLRTDENDEPRHVEPQHQDDGPAERAVGVVVVGEIRDVELEGQRRGSAREPPRARHPGDPHPVLLRVRAEVVEHEIPTATNANTTGHCSIFHAHSNTAPRPTAGSPRLASVGPVSTRPKAGHERMPRARPSARWPETAPSTTAALPRCHRHD